MLETFLTQRARLFGIAYRMVGSVAEAEDILQEAWLRFQAVEPTEVRSAEALLTTIVTRLALNQLKAARTRREQYPGIWLPEPILTPAATSTPALGDDPLDSVMKLESISFAFLHLLENLTAEERAVFLLREVFDYPYAEIANFLQKSEAACRQLLSRAKKHLRAHRPSLPASHNQASQQEEPSAAGGSVVEQINQHQRIFTTFLQATQQGDITALMKLMAEDVIFYADGGGKAIAAKRRVVGRQRVARLIDGLKRTGFKIQEPVELLLINGRHSLVAHNAQGAATLVMSLAIVDGLIAGIYIVRNPDKLQRL